MIPKIIHQTGPRNKQKWNPLWFTCQESVLQNFKDFEYIFWDDESIDNFVKNNFPEEYDTFFNAQVSIIKIDLFNYMCLYVYGGITIHLDVYVYKNFYNELVKPVVIQETAENCKQTEFIQNAIIASRPKEPFIKKLIDLTIERIKENKNTNLVEKKIDGFDVKDPNIILYISGPKLMTDVYFNYDKKEEIQVLPNNIYNPVIEDFSPQIYCKHLMSGFWGKETYENTKISQEKSNQEWNQFVKNSYSNFRLNNSSFDNFIKKIKKNKDEE